jgi:signal transduction histidine kinase/DNA-binding NarL/FixJ family response regulator
MKRKSWSIVVKFILMVVIAQIFLLAGTGFLLGNFFLENENQARSNRNFLSARSLAASLDAQLEGFIDTLNLLASLPAFNRFDRNEIRNYLRNDYGSQVFQPSERVIVLDINSNPVADNSVSGLIEAQDIIGDFQTVMLSHPQPYVSDVLFTKLIPKFNVAVSILSTRTYRGSVLAEFSLNRFFEYLSNEPIGRDILVILSDDEQNVVYHTNRKYVIEPHKMQDIGFATPEQILVEHPGLEGEYMVSTAWASLSRLHVHILEKEVDLLSLSGNPLMLFILTVAFGLLSTTLISLFVYHQVLRPVNRLSSRIVQEQDGIHLAPYENDPNTQREDEIGVLYQGFVDLLSRILARETDLKQSRDELKEYTENLEQKVRERTRELELANLSLEEKSQFKSKFLANMSHELRTPLNAILGFSGLLQKEDKLGPKELGRVEVIRKSGEHLLSLINNILSLTKIEAGKMVVLQQAFSPKTMMQEVEKLFTVLIREKGLSLVFEVDPEVPEMVQSDIAKVRQILTNLLSNAVKFTQEGGITVRLRSQPDGDFLHLHFEVEDTGPGIDPEDQKKLFRDFVQTETGIQSQQGTGLGLVLCREYCRILGGNISVESTPGKGSLFRFSILVTEADQGEDSAQRPLPLRTNEPWRMLVIDDNPLNIQLLQETLESYGFIIDTALDAQEGLRKWKENHQPVVWMDRRMPGMDGLEATKALRKVCPADTPLWIISISASVLEAEQKATVEAGSDAFVCKPYTDGDLIDVLEKVVGISFNYPSVDETKPSEPDWKSVPIPEDRLWRDELIKACEAEIFNGLQLSWKSKTRNTLYLVNGDAFKLTISN